MDGGSARRNAPNHTQDKTNTETPLRLEGFEPRTLLFERAKTICAFDPRRL
jgi:hypothetical protein